MNLPLKDCSVQSLMNFERQIHNAERQHGTMRYFITDLIFELFASPSKVISISFCLICSLTSKNFELTVNLTSMRKDCNIGSIF